MIRFTFPLAAHADGFRKRLAVAAIVAAALTGAVLLALLGPVPWRGSSGSSPELPRAVASSWFAGPGVSFSLDSREFHGLTVTIDGTLISTEFNIARISWDWGDGTVEESWFPARHTYPEPGEYTLTVQVYDDRGTRIAGQSGPINVAN
jgi:hypothetical protein